MFELTLPVTLSVVSKMIINEELMASLDEPTHSIVMHRTEPTRLQSLALQLSEKVAYLDNNERLMEMKQGNFFFPNKGYQGNDDRRQHKDSYNKDGNQGNRGGNYQNKGGYNKGGYNRGGGGGYGNKGYNRY